METNKYLAKVQNELKQNGAVRLQLAKDSAAQKAAITMIMVGTTDDVVRDYCEHLINVLDARAQK